MPSSTNPQTQSADKLFDDPPSPPPLPSSSLDAKYYSEFPNQWAKIRKLYVRDAASEFLGTMMLVLSVIQDLRPPIVFADRCSPTCLALDLHLDVRSFCRVRPLSSARSSSLPSDVVFLPLR